jgi:ABC-type amino acid transport substrate-binding protein
MLLVMAVTAIAVAPCAAVGQDQKQPLRFLGNKAIAPFISLEGGKPVGIVVDLAYALAAEADLSIAVEAMDWSTAQSEVLQGKADALLQINSDPQREQIYDFSDTLLVSNFQIFRKATRTDIQSLESLRGKKVGVESGGFPAQHPGPSGSPKVQ